MRPGPPLLALLLVAGPLCASAAPPMPASVRVDAPEVEWDKATGRYTLSGGITLKRGEVTLRARTATYDPESGEVLASGDVLLLEPGRVLAAAGARMILDGPLSASDVTAFVKERPLDLSAATTLEAGRQNGFNRATFTGSRLVRDDSEHLSIDDAKMTLCDCGLKAPSWQMGAKHADVIPGKRAILHWAVLYVTPRFLFIDKPVPVFALPWMYLPLGERQSGLLLPQLAWTGRNGFAVAEPLFLTLGDSFDVTLTPEYVFGGAAGQPLPGVRGPGGELEFRWAPIEGTRGRLRVSWLHDLASDAGQTRARGDRIGLTLFHDERLGDATFLRADLGLVTDPVYVRDFTGDVLLRAAEYRRSALTVTHRRDSLLFEADASWLEPLGGGLSGHFYDAASARVPFGTFGEKLAAFHRLPAASVTLMPLRLLGPLHVAASAGLARFAPASGPTGDEGALGIGPWDRSLIAAAPGAGGLDGAWQPGERLAATRLAARAELRAPFILGDAAALEAFIRGSAAAYSFAAGGPGNALDAWALGGATLSTSLSRTYGQGPDRIRHLVRPFAEWRLGSGASGPTLPTYAGDELDAAPACPAPGLPGCGTGNAYPPLRQLSALPGGPFDQLRLGIRNRLSRPAGSLSRDVFDLDVGQDLDLRERHIGETWVRGSAGLGPVSAGVSARYDAVTDTPCLYGVNTVVQPDGSLGCPPPARRTLLDRFTELRADLVVADRRGDNAHASLMAIGPGASARLHAGLDALFDPRPTFSTPSALLTPGLRLRVFPGLDLSYDMVFDAREQPYARCGAGPPTTPPHVLQHTAGFTWDSPCRCWRMALVAALRDCQSSPDFFATFDLARLAEGRFFP